MQEKEKLYYVLNNINSIRLHKHKKHAINTILIKNSRK